MRKRNDCIWCEPTGCPSVPVTGSGTAGRNAGSSAFISLTVDCKALAQHVVSQNEFFRLEAEKRRGAVPAHGWFWDNTD